MYKLIFLFFIAVLFFGCNEDAPSDQSVDNELIINHLALNEIEAFHYSDGLYYQIECEEAGSEFPNATSLVKVKYKGYLLDGTIIDSSNDEFVDVYLTECIEGLQMGLTLFSRKSNGMLFIPSTLGYGEFETPLVPSYSVLVYEIELKDFTN